MNLLAPITRLFSGGPGGAARRPKSSTLTTETAIDENAALTLLGSLPDPDEALRRAGIGREALRVLEYDDEIYAALETRREAVLSSDWRIEPHPESGQAGERAAALMWEWLEPIMQELQREIWSAVPYGYSVIENVYVGEGGLFRPIRATGKPFEWFAPKRDGGLIYRPPTGVPVEVDTRFKFILTRRAPTYRQPYGEALLSRLYWPWFLRGEGWKMWARHLERHGSPTLIGKLEIPPADRVLSNEEWRQHQEMIQGMLDQMRQELDRAVRSATVATTADITAINPANAGEAFVKFNTEIAKRIQKVVLGQTLTSDVQGGGSYAAAQVHDKVREDKRDADLRLIRDGVQRLINATAELNGWPAPVFAFAEEIDLQAERAERDERLSRAGIAHFTPDYLMRVYDYEEGDLGNPPEPRTGGLFSAPHPKAHQPGPLMFSANDGAPRAFTAGQQAVEDQVAEAVEGSSQALDPERVRSVILGASSPDDLRDRLMTLLDETDPQFAETLSRAQFAAAVLGYVAAEEGI